MHTPNDDRLIRALRAARDARLTGALRVAGRSVAGTLFFDAGHVYFGVLDGDKPAVDSFEKDGITRGMLQAASTTTRAGDRFADELMGVGAPGSAVRAFGRRSITTALAKFVTIEDARFSADDRRHPYGPAFTFDIDDLLEAIEVVPPKTKAAPVQPAQETVPMPTQPTGGFGGPAFKRRTGLRAAAQSAR
ncbi:MAG: hypothetical protein OEX04_07205 [Acidimicrobiia bacterium]|nr:hypothetical protein [Acidimicrobiia bacterium]MDH5293672.1 hypothetical protein [Acidimicrobiia bacterium]